MERIEPCDGPVGRASAGLFWEFDRLRPRANRVHALYLVDDGAPRYPIPIDRRFLQTYRYRPVVRAVTKVVAILEQYDGIIGLAKLAGAVGNGVEDRLDVGRRRSDHAEDVAAAGLVSQRLERSRVLACTSSNSRTFSIAITA